MVSRKDITVKILSIVGLLFLLVVGYSALAPQTSQAQQQTSSLQASTMAVTASPTISAHFIDTILCEASSPACGTGTDMYSLGTQYGVDPIFALAFFKHESSYGKYGIAAVNKGLGNIRCSSGYICKNGFRAYKTWADGYSDWYQLIRYYIDVLHKLTIDVIIETYAPSSENDTQGYIESVKTSVQEWRKQVAA